MAFDPDAFLGGAAPAPAAVGGGFDPDAFLGVSPHDVEKPSTLSSVGRGLAQGVTFGFADELAGAVESVFTDKTYKQARDESRAAYKAAQEAHPIAYGAAEIGGGIATSFIPVGAAFKGVGVAAKAGQALSKAPALSAALKAGAGGALGGLGASEADSAKGMLTDAAFSGGVSAVTGGAVSKLIGGASGRALKRTAKDIVEGDSTAKLSVAKKFGERAGGPELQALQEALDESPGLRRTLATSAASSPEKAARAVGKRLDQLSATTKPIYDQIDKKVGGVSVDMVTAKLDEMAKKFASAGEEGGSYKMVSAAKNVKKAWLELYGPNGETPSSLVSAKAVQRFKNDIASTAFANDPLVKVPIKAQAERMLHRQIGEAIEAAAKEAGADATALRAANREMSMWVPAIAALKERAEKEATGRSSLGTKLLGAAGLAGGGFAFGGPGGVAAGLAVPAALKVGRGMARHADYALARLAEMAAAGSTAAQLGKAALEMGLSRNVGEGMAAWAARRREAEATEPGP